MADDGVLINFDVGSKSFVPSATKFKGGSWVDRHQAEKRLRARARYEKERSLKPDQVGPSRAAGRQNSVKKDFAIEQPAKKMKLSQPNQGFSRHQPKGVKSEVVSSLFTFNPKAQNTTESVDVRMEPAAPSNAPLPPEVQSFASLGLSVPLATHLSQNLSITAPTAVQRNGISQLLTEDSDAFIQAETGSGKTLAYLLPILQRLYAISVDLATGKRRSDGITRDSGLFAVILAPTRELSKQISVVLESLLRFAYWLVGTTVTGGEKKKSEKARLRKGVNILIATPGRLADHLVHTKVLDVSKVRWLVLDEGDRLMELGFEQDIKSILRELDRQSKDTILEGLPNKRINILCSATMKATAQKLGELSLHSAVHIRADAAHNEPGNKPRDDQNTHFAAPAQLQQAYAIVPSKLRLVTLIALLKRTFSRKGSVMKTILFLLCADSVDFHFSVLARSDANLPSFDGTSDPNATSSSSVTLSTKSTTVQVFRLHGSLPQHTRTSTLAKYRACKDPALLICTDVASRGLDLPNVDFVIEYDPAFSSDDHLHRIGRTARAGNAGRALIFLLPGCEEGYVSILRRERMEGAHLVNHNADELLQKGFGTGVGSVKDWQAQATEWQLSMERWIGEDDTRLEMARRAFQSYIRAYATHVAGEREMFDITRLHLGHLCKAFALRERPGNMRVPGARPGKLEKEREKKVRRKSAGKSSSDVGGRIDEVGGGKERMARKMREQARLSEFNLG